MKVIRIILTSLIAALACTGIIYAATTVGSNISTGGTLSVTGASTLTGNTSIAGTLGVTGAATFTTASSTGAVKFSIINSDTGAISFGDDNLSTTGTLNITGLTTLGNASTTDITVVSDSTTAFIVQDTSSNVVLGVDTANSSVKASNFYMNDYNGRNTLDHWDQQIGLLVGDGADATSANVLLIGDSWLASGQGMKDFRRWLWDKYGHAGAGWVHAYGITSSASTAPEGITRSIGGSDWTDAVGSQSYTVGCSKATSVDTTSTMRITGRADTIVVYYQKKPGGGTFTWSINGGGTTAVDTSAVSATTIESVSITAGLTDSPTDYIDIAVSSQGSNGVTILGFDFQRDTKGARVTNIASGGTTSGHWAGIDATEWQSAITTIDPDLAIIMLGVNDQGQGITAAAYKNNIQTIITNLLAVDSTMSIVLSSQSDVNTGSATYTTGTDYLTALKDLATKNNTGFIDLFTPIGNYDNAISGFYLNTAHLDEAGWALMTQKWQEFFAASDILSYDPSVLHNFIVTDSRSDGAIHNGGLRYNQTGTYNTVVGIDILNNNTSGSANTAIGAWTLQNNTTGSYNFALGKEALQANTTGSSNIAIGYQAGEQLTTGGSNVLIGHQVGSTYLDTYSGNVFIGSQAGKQQRVSQNNVIIGYQAGYNGADASSASIDSVIIGYQAGYGLGWSTRDVIIGNDVCKTASNCGGESTHDIFAIDSADVAAPLLFGSFANGSEYLTVNGILNTSGDSIGVATSQSPASNAACTTGEIAWDANYIYVCTASTVWKRAALTGGY